jgi:hypothetical protein
MPKNILYKIRRPRKFNIESQTSTTVFAAILFTIFACIMIWLLTCGISATSLPTYCNSGSCNCCNMPRENTPLQQPLGWNCSDCPDGNIVRHPSHGWISLDIKGIESKIKKYKINLADQKTFTCLVDSMKSRKLNKCMKSLWPTVEVVPKQLCWRSWHFQDEPASIFEYTPCKYQSNFNILLPNSNSIPVDDFSKWWNNSNAPN